MSTLTIRGKGSFVRTHGEQVVHLNADTAAPDAFKGLRQRRHKATRPPKFLVMWIGAFVLAFLLAMAMITSIVPQSGLVGLLGIVILTMMSYWKERYYTQRPQRPRPTLVK